MLGLAMFQFLLLADFAAIPYKRQPNAPKAREVPPYNGFGSEEEIIRTENELTTSYGEAKYI